MDSTQTDQSWLEKLDEHFVREAFSHYSEVSWQPLHLGDAIFMDRDEAEAAVLLPLVIRPSGLHVLLTQRTKHLKAHAGQISFPGGRVEPSDESVEHAALRETQEETGIDPKFVDIIGQLPQYRTATNFLVTPIVGLVKPEFVVQADEFEVQEVFEVPLVFLMDIQNHVRHEVDTPKGKREFFSMPYPRADGGEPYFIWGATAAMLRNFQHYLSRYVSL